MRGENPPHTASDLEREKGERPSAFAVGAALIALGTLSVTAQGLPLLGVFALMILLSRIVPYRIRERSFWRWGLRVLAIAVVWVLTPDDSKAGNDALGSSHARNLFGEMCAAEMTLQFWRTRSYDPGRSSVALILATGMTFLTASNVYDARHIRFVTPVFLVFLAFMARDYRVRRPSAFTLRVDREAWARRRPPLIPLLLRIGALAISLAVGMIGYTVTSVNKSALTDLGNRVLSKSSWQFDMGGMSAQPELGPTFGLRGSAARVLLFQHYDSDPHIDGVFYTDYEQGRWGPAVTQLPWHAVSEAELQPTRTMTPRGGTQDVTVTRLVSDNPLLYLPLNTAAIDLGLDLTDASRGTPDGGPFRIRAAAPFVYHLTVPENQDYQGLFAQRLTDDQRKRCLTIAPKLPSELKRLAQSILGPAKSPMGKIGAVTAYLLEHHQYSLEYQPGHSDVDPLADFLLSDPPKAAHCEFFAAAAAILLRYGGVPTRYVTGYYLHESEGADTAVIRQRDAHAWCEAWVDGTGWVTVDATPGDGKPDALADLTPVEPWRRLYEWFQDKLQALTARVDDVTPTQFGVGIFVAVSLGVGGGILRTMLLRRRRGLLATAVGDRYTFSDATLADLARRFETAWQSRTGRALPANLSYTEFFRRLPQTTDTAVPKPSSDMTPPIPLDLIEAARRFARAYETVRFGGPAALDAEARDRMMQDLHQIEKKKA